MGHPPHIRSRNLTVRERQKPGDKEQLQCLDLPYQLPTLHSAGPAPAVRIFNAPSCTWRSGGVQPAFGSHQKTHQRVP